MQTAQAQQAIKPFIRANPLNDLLDSETERNALGLSRIGLRQRDGSVRELRNSILLPAYYLIPEEIMKKCGQELYSLPRFFSLLMLDPVAIETIESDLFVLCIIDCYAYMVWSYLCPDIPYMEIFSGDEPSWRIAHAADIWITELYRLDKIPTLREYSSNPYAFIPYAPPEVLDSILSEIVPSAVKRYDLQPIIDAAKETRCFEDFDFRESRQKIDFYRKWYHTRSKKAEFSLEGYKEHLMEVYDDGEWEVPDPVSSFEDEVIENVDVQKFLSTLPEKDKTILQMRQDGYTLQEIADELEYKTHSAVLKRIKSIGRKYEKYSGLSFGFKRLP